MKPSSTIGFLCFKNDNLLFSKISGNLYFLFSPSFFQLCNLLGFDHASIGDLAWSRAMFMPKLILLLK